MNKPVTTIKIQASNDPYGPATRTISIGDLVEDQDGRKWVVGEFSERTVDPLEEGNTGLIGETIVCSVPVEGMGHWSYGHDIRNIYKRRS